MKVRTYHMYCNRTLVNLKHLQEQGLFLCLWQYIGARTFFGSTNRLKWKQRKDIFDYDIDKQDITFIPVLQQDIDWTIKSKASIIVANVLHDSYKPHETVSTDNQ